MILKRLIIYAACLSAGLFSAMAAPEVYLRGVKYGNWSKVEPEYLFKEKEGTYTLHIDRLEGEFKIATEDWSTVDFGASSIRQVTEAGDYEMAWAGANFYCDGLDDVTLSFHYDGSRHATLTVSTNGQNPGPGYGVSGTLPVLHINVYKDAAHSAFDNEVISKDLDHKNYFEFSEYWLDLNGCEWMAKEGGESIGSAETPLPLEIKARGNWTRKGFAKKPYKIKLGEKQKMLGMSKSKHYTLLAHADDGFGYMRNFVGFNLGKRIGLPWTPSQQPVELVINGDYRGLYFLTEGIRVEKGRIEISELEDNVSDPTLISGGYLVELDNYDEENQIRMEERVAPGVNVHPDMLRVTWDTPEEYSELQKRFVTDQFSAINEGIGDNSDDTWSYLDLDDAARYYLVEEMISHVEAYHGSTYLFRDRGEGHKWHFSPLWDCGNAFVGPTDDYFYKHAIFGATWIPSMRVNGKFNDKVRDTWMWFMTNRYEGLEADIDAYAAHIAEAAKADRKRWKDRPVPQGGTSVADNSDMAARKKTVLDHLRAKLRWMKGAFGDYTATGTVPEPERDDTPAAPLPDYVLSGILDVIPETDIPVEYYDLTGMRISAPEKGNIVIVRRGEKAYKVIY